MYTFDEKFKKGAARAFRAQNGMTAFLGGLNKLLPEPPAFGECKTKEEEPTVARIADTAGDRWYLGFSEQSIVPRDVGEKAYYIGGNLSLPPRRVRGVLDDIKVRVIALSDGEGKAAEIFCVVDCIGLTNTTVRRIRRELDSFSRTDNVGYINVFSTHAHSSIDTMGIWSVTGKKFFKNISKLISRGQPEPSVDGEIIDRIIRKTKKAVAEAVGNMEPGRLYAAQIGTNSIEKLEKYSEEKPYDDMTLDEYGMRDFLFAKRPPREYSPRLNRLRFVPDNKASRPTVLANFGAHPYANGLKIKSNKGNMLSADFPFYMERTVNEAGENFIFFNAAVNGIYPRRGAGGVKEENFTRQTEALGRDLGKLVLAMTKERDEIEKSPLLSPENSGEAYKDAVERIGRGSAKERELEPKLTSVHKKIALRVDNPLEKMIGKLGFACFDMTRPERGAYELETETGYLELGGDFKVVLVPGEITPGLVSGTGDMLAENSITGEASDFKSICDIVGGDTAVFGLANDALGYIIPDNDYCMFFAGYGKLAEKLFFKDYAHYQEMFSIGAHTASSFSAGVEGMMKSFRELSEK